MTVHKPHIVPGVYKGRRTWRCYTWRNPHKPTGGVGRHGSAYTPQEAYAKWLQLRTRK